MANAQAKVQRGSKDYLTPSYCALKIQNGTKAKVLCELNGFANEASFFSWMHQNGYAEDGSRIGKSIKPVCETVDCIFTDDILETVKTLINRGLSPDAIESRLDLPYERHIVSRKVLQVMKEMKQELEKVVPTESCSFVLNYKASYEEV